jgi:hypothetical protein
MKESENFYLLTKKMLIFLIVFYSVTSAFFLNLFDLFSLTELILTCFFLLTLTILYLYYMKAHIQLIFRFSYVTVTVTNL